MGADGAHGRLWRRYASLPIVVATSLEIQQTKSRKQTQVADLRFHIPAVFGPGATKWYQLLQSRVAFKSKPGTLVARLAADQFIFAPVNLTLFLSYMAYFEGVSIKKKLQDKYWEILRINWSVWPLVQGVNFTLVPLQHRVLVVNVVSLGKSLAEDVVRRFANGGQAGIAS